MPATAQNRALTQKLNGLATVRLVKQHTPRDAGTVALPAQPRIDPRRDALAAKIAAQLSARAESDKARVVKSPSPAQSLLNTLFDIPTLAVSFAATALLVGAAFVTMILTGAIDTPWSDQAAAPEQRAAVTVLSASAADAPIPVAAQPSAPPVRPVRTVALPAADQGTSEPVDASATEAANNGPGLFGDVHDVYRGDGESGVPFGAVYGTPETNPEVAAIPDEPAQPPVEEQPPVTEVAEPQANEDAEAKWIELPIAVNLRASPSTRSKVIGVMEKGARLQELERKRGWVKVTDPETSETGWLYPNSAPRARRATKQQATQENKSAPTGPFATLGNWLGKPVQQ